MESCRQLAESAEDGAFDTYVFRMLEHIVFASDGAWISGGAGRCGIGRSLFWAYGRSGDIRCKQAIESLIKRLNKTDLRDADAKMLYFTQPFYMEYETKCHNKAGYNEIVKRMLKAAGTIAGGCTQEMGWYLLALSDVIECMSMEIYEHYRTLTDLLKEIIKGYVCADGSNAGTVADAKESFLGMLAYAILKACSLGCLNTEKYQHIGRKLADDVIHRELSGEDLQSVAIRMMLRAQVCPKKNAET